MWGYFLVHNQGTLRHSSAALQQYVADESSTETETVAHLETLVASSTVERSTFDITFMMFSSVQSTIKYAKPLSNL